MIKVVFDSSFLMAVAEGYTTWRDDITERIGRFEPLALDCVLTELGAIASRRDKRGRTARIALQLSKGFTQIPCGKSRTDDEILSAALTLNAMVATIDRELVASLKSRHRGAIGLRAGRVTVT